VKEIWQYTQGNSHLKNLAYI